MDRLKVLIASDSFKGSLSSKQVAMSMIEGFDKTGEKFDYSVFQVADGGEGTVESVTHSLGGEILECEVTDVFRNKTKAILGDLGNGTCILETASPCGLDKISDEKINPMIATSYGIGEVITQALDKGFKKIYIGLGGSSVNDGGIGLATALGAKILDDNGYSVPDGAIGLSKVSSIDLGGIDKRLKNTELVILSDVKNTLIGPNGATAIYGPQKGIKEDEVEQVDGWMEKFGLILSEVTGKDIINTPSSGAAGGLGATLIGLTDAEVRSGIEAVVELLGIEEKIKEADIVFTGEGQMDGQSLNGKAPLGIAKIASKHGKPVIAIVGSKKDDYTKVLDYGLDLVLDIVDRPMELKEAIDNAKEYVARTAYASMKLFLSMKKKLAK